MPKRNKKSKFKHVVIGSKKYYFYRLEWIDITGDAGHASIEEFDKFECSKMITHAYIYKRTSKFVWTFASYEDKIVEELNEIVSGDSIFCATGITSGDLVQGINFNQNSFTSETLITHKSSKIKTVVKLTHKI